MQKIINMTMDLLYLIVGLASIIVSIKFSYAFFRYNNHDIEWAMTISIIYILFLTMIFEEGIKKFVTAKKLTRERDKSKNDSNRKVFNKVIRKRYFVGSLILLSWGVLTTYSVISTIGGQYDLITKMEGFNSVDTVDTKELNSIISIKVNQKAILIKEVNIIEKRLASVEDVEKSYKYKKTGSKNELRLDELRDKIFNIDLEIIQYKSKISEHNANKNSVSNGNIYNYFERIFKIPAFKIQFILSLFPSIMVDIFAPVSFALFLYRKKG